MSYINVTGTYSAIKFLPSGNMELVFEISFRQKGDLLRGIDEITAAGLPELSIKAEKKRKKRSLDANDYLWVLCTKIAEKLQDGKTMVTKEEVYRKHIREAGVYQPLPIKNDAIERFSEVWGECGTGWFIEIVDDSKLPGYKKVFAYYGSSVYDTKEMSRLIDSVIEDCRALNIETMPPAELDMLLKEWGGNERKS